MLDLHVLEEFPFNITCAIDIIETIGQPRSVSFEKGEKGHFKGPHFAKNKYESKLKKNSGAYCLDLQIL